LVELGVHGLHEGMLGPLQRVRLSPRFVGEASHILELRVVPARD
jgi:hypothetical protein